MRRRLAAMLLFAGVALGQPQPPAGPTVRVEGRVLSNTGEPLSKSTVLLFPAGRQVGPGEDLTQVVAPLAPKATTDQDGKFAIEASPGRYTLTAGHNGYLNASYAVGSELTLKAGEPLSKMDLVLAPHAVITGQILDQFGEPAVGVEVRIVRYAYSGGRRQLRLEAVAASPTDDRGMYRVPGLVPGNYYVFAEDNSNAGFNGPARMQRVGMASSSTALLPVYYPGSRTLSGAGIVEVKTGNEVKADIRMRREAVHAIRGTVMSRTTGQPSAKAVVGLLPEAELPPSQGVAARAVLGRADGGRPQVFAASIQADPQGRFVLYNVPEGPHTLVGFGGERAAIRIAGGGTVTFGEGGSKADNGASGMLRISVPNADLEGVILTVSAPGQIRGKMIAEGTELKSLMPPPTNLPEGPVIRAALLNSRLLRVRLEPVESRFSAENTDVSPAPKDDGTFTLTPVVAGRFYVTVDNLPAGYYLKSVRFGGKDITGAQLEFDGGEGEMQVTVAKGAMDISGTAPASSVVSLWPKNPDRSRPDGNILQAVADRSGAVRFEKVPPGEYYLIAFEKLPEEGLAQYAPFLARFNGEASSIRLEPSGTASPSMPVVSEGKAAAEAAKLP